MERLKRSAIVLSLIERLREKGGWCGETHIQKTTYFLQELLNVPLGFNFILYKHGPYSFDLSDELMAMRADMLIQLKSQQPYGPSIVPGPTSEQLKRLFPKTLRTYESRVHFIADQLANYGVADLERIATAFFIANVSDMPTTTQQMATKINKIKPHISTEEALKALETESKLTAEAKELLAV
ncbi:MAG: hypothetical protein IIB56_18655 [Planctomycetes bacterium]|nr:hypothetical protein [Planctomycetota bacterium]